MTRYALTAYLDGDSRVVGFEEEDSFGATLAAMREVLDLAHADPSGPWALGRIELRDERGDLLHAMPAKAGERRTR